MLYDFHTHTYHSDGILSPIELIRHAVVNGYTAIAVTDHCGPGSLRRLVKEVSEDCALVRAHWSILAIPGVELTHLPAAAIDESARRAKQLGARVVIVHGETVTEPVDKGTNLAAVKSPWVDVLAHPGRMTLEEAELAAKNGVFLELTARRAHSATNAHVVSVARQAGARLLVNSDAHTDADMLTPELARETAREAGLSQAEAEEVLTANPRRLLDKLSRQKPL